MSQTQKKSETLPNPDLTHNDKKISQDKLIKLKCLQLALAHGKPTSYEELFQYSDTLYEYIKK